MAISPRVFTRRALRATLAVVALAVTGRVSAEEALPAEQAPGSITVRAGSLKFSGLVQVWAVNGWAQDDPDHIAAFRLRRAEFKATGEIQEGLSWWLMIDPALVMEDKDNTRRSILKDMVVAYDLPLPWRVRLQFGQFKIPFGMEGLYDSGTLDTVERSLIAPKLRWTDFRDIGGMAHVQHAGFNLWTGVFNGEGKNRTTDATDHKNVNVRATWQVLSWWALGAAYQHGRSGISEALNEHSGAETSWHWNLHGIPVRLKGEYAFGSAGPPLDLPTGVRTGYGMLAVDVIPGALELVGKYDWLDENHRKARDWRTEATAGFNWRLAGHHAKIQGNYVRVDEPTPKIRNDLVRLNFQTHF